MTEAVQFLLLFESFDGPDFDDLVPIAGKIEAERFFDEGYPVYAAHEMDEELVLMRSREMIGGYSDEFFYDPAYKGQAFD